ncbi:hypothetical protein GCM10009111_17770 [Colwellia asteriadis]|uniref:Uncharacterized protein n=1 Tax=Colwellia asteriadis TaxID=517723 RepID=A0ABN1L7E8_9GAMM
MNLNKWLFIAAILCFVNPAQGVVLQQDQFTYNNVDQWQRIISLSAGGFVLKNNTTIMTFESWEMRELLADHEEYIKSLEQEEALYSVEDFIHCSLNYQCVDNFLKSFSSHQLVKNVKPLIDVCIDVTIHCVIFNTPINNYTFEAYVYTASNNDYFIRILTNITSQSELSEHLNAIKLD